MLVHHIKLSLFRSSDSLSLETFSLEFVGSCWASQASVYCTLGTAEFLIAQDNISELGI